MQVAIGRKITHNAINSHRASLYAVNLSSNAKLIKVMNARVFTRQTGYFVERFLRFSHGYDTRSDGNRYFPNVIKRQVNYFFHTELHCVLNNKYSIHILRRDNNNNYIVVAVLSLLLIENLDIHLRKIKCVYFFFSIL